MQIAVRFRYRILDAKYLIYFDQSILTLSWLLILHDVLLQINFTRVKQIKPFFFQIRKFALENSFDM